MLKKINQWLLTHWPLIWNTGAVWVLFCAALLHAAVYLLGWNCYTGLQEFNGYYSYRHRFEGVMWFSVFAIVLFIILWLIAYFRHNALKSFYPVNRFYLFKEFILVFTICSSVIMIIYSASAGLHHAVEYHTKDFDLKKDAQVLNTAACFLPYDREDFERSQCCDSQAVQYRRNDSLAFLHAGKTDSCDLSPAVYEEPEEPEEYANYTAPVETIQKKEYSYLYYCRIVCFEDDLTQEQYHAKADRWITGEKRDSILQSLKAFNRLVARYRISDTINPEKYTAFCFLDSIHSLPLANIDELSSINDINEKIQGITYYRSRPPMNSIDVIVMLYISLVLSLLIFSFRITRLRTWIMSLVGVLLWVIILSASTMTRDENAFSNGIYVLTVLFGLGAVFLIRSGTLKTLGGMTFTWFMGIQVMTVPLVFWSVYSNTFQVRECVDHIMTVTYEQPPIHDWIMKNWTTIHLGNILLTFALMFFLLIPLAIKWQSNPEE